MLSREELMAKVMSFTDGELENAVRAVEVQREITQMMLKDKASRVENGKTKLTDISISVIGALKADNCADLISEVNKMQTALEEAKKESPQGCIDVEKFNVNCSSSSATCNFTINIDLNRDQIQEMNNKIGRAFF